MRYERGNKCRVMLEKLKGPGERIEEEHCPEPNGDPDRCSPLVAVGRAEKGSNELREHHSHHIEPSHGVRRGGKRAEAVSGLLLAAEVNLRHGPGQNDKHKRVERPQVPGASVENLERLEKGAYSKCNEPKADDSVLPDDEGVAGKHQRVQQEHKKREVRPAVLN